MLKPRIVATIEARMQSSRLPGKILKNVLGKPLLELMVERLRRVEMLDDIVVATTIDSSCDVIEKLAGKLGINCFRGSEEDVLDRVLRAAQYAKADLIVETTGDCPLIDPETVDRVIRNFLSNNVDYCSNTLKRTFPRGMDVQIFPLRILEEVASLTHDPVDREHVSIYIYEHPEKFRLLNVESGLQAKFHDLRLTVDTPEDLELITRIYEKLYSEKPAFKLSDIMDVFERNPDLAMINRQVNQKAVR